MAVLSLFTARGICIYTSVVMAQLFGPSICKFLSWGLGFSAEKTRIYCRDQTQDLITSSLIALFTVLMRSALYSAYNKTAIKIMK